MANLDDLPIPSITEMSTDEAIEMLRQVRLSRRIPVKKTKKTTAKKSKTASKVNSDQASELLKILTGE